VIYTRLAVTPSDPSRREAVSAALFRAGAEGLLEDGAAFVTVFSKESDARAAETAARTADVAAHSVCAAFDPGDYTEAWRRGVRAHTVGTMVIAPPWLANEHDPATTIVVEPSTGFGTGEHETTRATLLLLQEVVRTGDTVIDAGCGSGVLAIAAARLGAARVIAIDNDPQAIANADDNVARNGAVGRVTVIEGDAVLLAPLLAPARVIVANITATALVVFLPAVELALAPGGDVIVGGVLHTERDSFVRNAAQRGWRVEREHTEGQWWSGHLRRRHE
jgi:ribosomal protein L11 methyltransferase